jgi:SAM-dependent methyltransferase
MDKLNTLGLAHRFMRQYVTEGDHCIDATAGRGHDTAFLSELVGASGKVTAFDIQQEALDSTDGLLREKGFRERVELILDSHANMARYAKEGTVSCIAFNFGYLPGGDHRIATRAESSIPAIETGLRSLKDGGVMSLCIYYGGDTGFAEKDALIDYLKTIDSKQYTVLITEFANRPNNPPIPVFILKRI